MYTEFTHALFQQTLGRMMSTDKHNDARSLNIFDHGTQGVSCKAYLTTGGTIVTALSHSYCKMMQDK